MRFIAAECILEATVLFHSKLKYTVWQEINYIKFNGFAEDSSKTNFCEALSAVVWFQQHSYVQFNTESFKDIASIYWGEKHSKNKHTLGK